jgi:gamma-glutamylcyclotransferase (GGCT)/AIG2-like uncharacterized protein YtfP
MYDMTIFCYGTLQSKQANSRFCRKAKSIEKATICGKLYQLPPGYPALQVPIETVLWQGTRDVFADAQNQYMENDDIDFEYKIYEGWDTVHGELLTFSDPERDMQPIDDLESFPHYYDRVLVPARKTDGSIIAAYVYVMDKINVVTARYLPDGVWPEKRRKEVSRCQTIETEIQY